MYFRKKTSGRAGLSPDRAQPAGRGVSASGDRHPRASGRARVERSVGATGALGRAVRDPGDGAERGAGRRERDGPAVGPALVFERLWTETGCRRRSRPWPRSASTGSRWSGDLPQRAAPADGRRLRPGGRPLARGLPDRRRRGAGAPSSLSSDGVAWRGIAGAGAGRTARRSPRVAPRTWSRSGCSATGAISSAGSIRVHGHDQPLLRRRGPARPSAAAGTARTRRSPPTTEAALGASHAPGPLPDDPGSPDRWRRAAGLLGDVARQYGRRHHADSGDRPAAPALRDRPDLRGRRRMMSAETVAALEAREAPVAARRRERTDKGRAQLVSPTPRLRPLTITRRAIDRLQGQKR